MSLSAVCTKPIYQNLTVSGFTGGGVRRVGTARITYSFLEQVNVNAGRGSNTIDVESTPSIAALHALTVDAGAGPDTIRLAGFLPASPAITVLGGADADVLVGPDFGSTWYVTGMDAGSLPGVTFQAVESLRGGALSDSFIFSDSAGVSGSIDGGGGINTLNYSAYTTPVVVALSEQRATGVKGQAAGSVRNIRNVIGGSANDLLVGDEHANTLDGGTGRDLLIGRAGADDLQGGSDDDILIPGTTAYDADLKALAAILAEWASARDYATRVANLRGEGTGPRLNGSYVLRSDGPNRTVFDDGAADVLTGGAGRDWFFVNRSGAVLDFLTDPQDDERRDELTP